ncbi:MAG: hypothetical protein RLY35_1150 [Bacteroidota bacterium]|jgi:hypothetical protein
MLSSISFSEKSIKGEFCPYCKMPTCRVDAASISTHVPLKQDDVVYQCVNHPQHFVFWDKHDIHRQGTLADPYLRACRYWVTHEIEQIVAGYADPYFTRSCVARYINYKSNNGHSPHFNVQLLSVQDCFKSVQIVQSADWQKLIPNEWTQDLEERIQPAKKWFKAIMDLRESIEWNVFEETLGALSIEMPRDVFVSRTFQLIDFFQNCGDQFLRLVPAQCAVCYAQSDALGFLLIGNQSWNYCSFLFHFKGNKLLDVHDCGSMVHACQHLPLQKKYSFQKAALIDFSSLYN